MMHGRHEVEPPPDRLMPEPAETFSRGWSTQSEPLPAELARQRAHMYHPGAEAPPPGVRRCAAVHAADRRRATPETASISDTPARPPRVQQAEQDAGRHQRGVHVPPHRLRFAIAGCAAFVAPASADRECFDNICRMPEVIEPPAALAQAAEQPQQPNVEAVPPATTERGAPPPIVPQMAVDALPRPGLEPLARRPVDPAPHRSAAPTVAPTVA